MSSPPDQPAQRGEIGGSPLPTLFCVLFSGLVWTFIIYEVHTEAAAGPQFCWSPPFMVPWLYVFAVAPALLGAFVSAWAARDRSLRRLALTLMALNLLTLVIGFSTAWYVGEHTLPYILQEQD